MISKSFFAGFVVCFGIFIGLSLIPQSESYIPPTVAFSQIFSGGQSINATRYNDNFTMATQGAITTSISQNQITIKLIEKTCSAGEAFVAIASNGTLVCGTP